MGSGSFLKVVARNFDVLAGPFVTLVYPLYASVKAIETKSPVDDQQWLTYWVLYSLVTLFELTFAKIIEWLPFWPYAKLIFYCWLVLPYFSGAAYVYQHYVRPIFVNQQTVNIWYVPRKKDIFSRPDDVLVAAEKFIEENGPEAFEKLLNKKGKAGKSKKGNRVVTFSEPEPEPERESKFWKNSESERESKFWKNSEPERESKFWKNSHHFEEVEPEREPQSWQNNNFTIFDDDNRYY